jgi:hypothetical protein
MRSISCCSLQAVHSTVARCISQSMVQTTDLELLQNGQLKVVSSLGSACKSSRQGPG